MTMKAYRFKSSKSGMSGYNARRARNKSKFKFDISMYLHFFCGQYQSILKAKLERHVLKWPNDYGTMTPNKASKV